MVSPADQIGLLFSHFGGSLVRVSLWIILFHFQTYIWIIQDTSIENNIIYSSMWELKSSSEVLNKCLYHQNTCLEIFRTHVDLVICRNVTKKHLKETDGCSSLYLIYLTSTSYISYCSYHPVAHCQNLTNKFKTDPST